MAEAVRAMDAFLASEAAACQEALFAIPSGGSSLPDAFARFVDDPNGGCDLDNDGLEVLEVKAASEGGGRSSSAGKDAIICIDLDDDDD